jgi:hypothetical protein
MAPVVTLDELIKERLGQLTQRDRDRLEDQAVTLVSKVPNLDRRGALEILYRLGRLQKRLEGLTYTARR